MSLDLVLLKIYNLKNIFKQINLSLSTNVLFVLAVVTLNKVGVIPTERKTLKSGFKPNKGY